MREYEPTGFDPRPYLDEIASPSLWLFGDKDRSVPVDLSVGILVDVRRERG